MWNFPLVKISNYSHCWAKEFFLLHTQKLKLKLKLKFKLRPNTEPKHEFKLYWRNFLIQFPSSPTPFTFFYSFLLSICHLGSLQSVAVHWELGTGKPGTEWFATMRENLKYQVERVCSIGKCNFHFPTIDILNFFPFDFRSHASCLHSFALTLGQIIITNQIWECHESLVSFFAIFWMLVAECERWVQKSQL